MATTREVVLWACVAVLWPATQVGLAITEGLIWCPYRGVLDFVDTTSKCHWLKDWEGETPSAAPPGLRIGRGKHLQLLPGLNSHS